MDKIDYFIAILITILCISLIAFGVTLVSNTTLPDPNSNQSVNISNNTPTPNHPTLKVTANHTNNTTNHTNPANGTVIEIKDLGNGQIQYKIADGKGGYYYKKVNTNNNEKNNSESN